MEPDNEVENKQARYRQKRVPGFRNDFGSNSQGFTGELTSGGRRPAG
ncbi:hypothetical protein [Planosporangium sp. 12N6]